MSKFNGFNLVYFNLNCFPIPKKHNKKHPKKALSNIYSNVFQSDWVKTAHL